MSMFRSLWNSFRTREGLPSRDASRGRNASQDTESARDSQAVHLPRQISDFPSDSNTDSIFTFYKRQRSSGLDIVLDKRDVNRESSKHSQRVMRNSRDYDTLKDVLTYLHEEPSTTSSTALRIENYTTYASDLKEKVEEPRKSRNSLNAKQQQQPELEDDKYKTITIRTLSKATRDELRNEKMENPDDSAALQDEIQIHDTSLHRIT